MSPEVYKIHAQTVVTLLELEKYFDARKYLEVIVCCCMDDLDPVIKGQFRLALSNLNLGIGNEDPYFFLDIAASNLRDILTSLRS